jgi:hypothetical protein
MKHIKGKKILDPSIRYAINHATVIGVIDATK